MHLNVGSNSLRDEGVALLAPVLRGMTGLQHLDVSYNFVGSRGMAALAPALAALPNLRTLDLSGCELKNGFMWLQPLLAKAGSPLRQLALCETMFMLGGAQAVAAGLSTAQQLRELNLQYINMWDSREKGWMALASGLHRLGPSLQSLKLGNDTGCNLSTAVAAALAAALQPLTGLTHLEAISLSSSATMVDISPALMGMRRLQVLSLHATYVGAEGTAAIAEVLPALSGSLTHLTLSYCSIGAEAAAGALAPALAQATGLVELHLKDNPFGPPGGHWLPPVLTTLHKVDLSSCHLDGQGCMAIVCALKDRDGMLVQLGNNQVISSSAEGNALRSTPGIRVLL